MRAYCIFDDFPDSEVEKLTSNNIQVDVLGHGKARPSSEQMKEILENYEIAIIGTSQRITENMWENVTTTRIIGTASVGTNHICIPNDKKHLLTVLNTPTANSQSVAEYIIGCALMCRKRLIEGNNLYKEGKNNKSLFRKPEDIHNTVVGLIGAGHIAGKVMELFKPFGVKLLCYSKNPDKHENLVMQYGVEFVLLQDIAQRADIIVTAVPSDASTQNLINRQFVSSIRNDCIFISVARAEVMDIEALLEKARQNKNFYVCLDLDVHPDYAGKNNEDNIVITPHIGGGTIEARKRMFTDVTDRIIQTVGEL